MVENDQNVFYSEDEQEMSTRCHAHFKKCEFGEALTLLKQLSAKRPNDFRIKHNLAICDRIFDKEFIRTGTNIKMNINFWARVVITVVCQMLLAIIKSQTRNKPLDGYSIVR
jgi:hypothetical protein